VVSRRGTGRSSRLKGRTGRHLRRIGTNEELDSCAPARSVTSMSREVNLAWPLRLSWASTSPSSMHFSRATEGGKHTRVPERRLRLEGRENARRDGYAEGVKTTTACPLTVTTTTLPPAPGNVSTTVSAGGFDRSRLQTKTT
jgi:hypothetical protein